MCKKYRSNERRSCAGAQGAVPEKSHSCCASRVADPWSRGSAHAGHLSFHSDEPKHGWSVLGPFPPFPHPPAVFFVPPPSSSAIPQRAAFLSWGTFAACLLWWISLTKGPKASTTCMWPFTCCKTSPPLVCLLSSLHCCAVHCCHMYGKEEGVSTRGKMGKEDDFSPLPCSLAAPSCFLFFVVILWSQMSPPRRTWSICGCLVCCANGWWSTRNLRSSSSPSWASSAIWQVVFCSFFPVLSRCCLPETQSPSPGTGCVSVRQQLQEFPFLERVMAVLNRHTAACEVTVQNWCSALTNLCARGPPYFFRFVAFFFACAVLCCLVHVFLVSPLCTNFCLERRSGA